MRPPVEEMSIEALRQEFLESKELQFACIENFRYGQREDFIKLLQTRANSPHLIAQSGTPLCGPAAFMYCVASKRKGTDDYERYVLGLATRGIGKLGNLTVTPGRDCRNAVRNEKIEPVDWIALASLRDSSNRFWDMEKFNSNIAGITFSGDMVKWFSQTGWYSSVGDSSWYAQPGEIDYSRVLSSLLDINLRSEGHICLLINDQIVQNPLRPSSAKIHLKTRLGLPTHWIVLNSRISIGNRRPLCGNIPMSAVQQARQHEEQISFSYWTWGKGLKKEEQESWHICAPVAQFLPYYYGYVSATF